MLELTVERDAALAETDRLGRQLESQQAQLQSLQSQLATEHDAGAQTVSRSHVPTDSQGLGLGSIQVFEEGHVPGSEATAREAAAAAEEREAAIGKLQLELAEARVQLEAVTARLAEATAAAAHSQGSLEEALSAREAELKVRRRCMLECIARRPF